MSDGDEDDEDDWFERALRDEDANASGPGDGEGADGESDAGDRGGDADGDGPADGITDDGTDSGSESRLERDSDGDPFGGTDGPFGGTDGPFGESDRDPFDDVPDDQLGGSEGPLGGGRADGSVAGENASGGLFEEEFGQAMGSVDGGAADFEDEDFESDIPRLDLGIRGLDNMVQGGVPLRHLVVVVGGAGTGKTTFGLQFVNHGLEKADTDKSVFITLEQTREDIMATAEEHGWAFERHERTGNLAVIDLDPIEMANSLDNIQNELPALIEDFGADRFVLDSVSLLEMMYDSVARRRTEVFDFTQSLKEAGVTTVLTSEAAEDNPYVSRHGIIEYLTDAVFLLRYVRSETQETRLAVEIQKIRNANHSRATKPYEITMDGISVYEQANIF